MRCFCCLSLSPSSDVIAADAADAVALVVVVTVMLVVLFYRSLPIVVVALLLFRGLTMATFGSSATRRLKQEDFSGSVSLRQIAPTTKQSTATQQLKLAGFLLGLPGLL